VNVQQAHSVNSKLSREEEELESLKTECNDAGCKIQSLQAETESIRALVGQLSQSVMKKKIIKHYNIQLTENEKEGLLRFCKFPNDLVQPGQDKTKQKRRIAGATHTSW